MLCWRSQGLNKINNSSKKKSGAEAKNDDRRKKRLPKKATPKHLERVGLYYLERYASSVENFRRVLMRRVERSARAHDTDRDEGAEAIDGIIQRFQEWGYLDDKAYAEMRAVSLFRRGTSRRGIRYQLSMKGVLEDAIDAALESVFENETDPDRRAAIAYARRRRIGPWRQDNRDTFQERDLAALGRQGFAYGIARWIVEADSPEACEASLSDDEGG